jgi:hypothetical protein
MLRRKRALKDPNEEFLRTTAELWERAQASGLPESEFTKVVMDGIDNSIPAFVDRLLHDMPQMLRNRRRLARGFERRLRDRWGRALDLYRASIEVALESGSDFNEKHRPAAAEENDFLFEALTRLHARACTTALEVFTLLQSGYETGAHARWRTLHELSVVSNVLVEAEQANDLAERFLLHSGVEDAQDARIYQRHAPALGYEPFDEDAMRRLSETRDGLIRRFGEEFDKRNGWAATLFDERAPTFSRLEELANMAHMRPWYSFTSHRVHPGSKGAAISVTHRGPNRIMIAGATNIGLADPGHGSLIALTQVTTCLLLRTRVASLGTEPTRLVIAKALISLTERVGDAFLAAHTKLEADEQNVWAKSDSSIVPPDIEN